ncbi:MAG: hypothetical protein H6557_22565 [Lewinellaceae bacterium]|nr:hypothetical protein [Lewinellaceae bacterium]
MDSLFFRRALAEGSKASYCLGLSVPLRRKINLPAQGGRCSFTPVSYAKRHNKEFSGGEAAVVLTEKWTAKWQDSSRNKKNKLFFPQQSS